MAAAASTPFESLLGRLARVPSAAPRVSIMATLLDCTADALGEAIAAAAAAGMVETWADGPGGPRVALTPLAAARMGLRLDPEGVHYGAAGPRPCFLGRWTGRPERPPRVAPAPADDGEDNEPDLLAELPDHRTLAPELAAMAAEAAEKLPTAAEATPQSRSDFDPARIRRAALDPDRLPEPFLILGLRLPWPVSFHGGPCPAGHGERLPPIAACLVCDRSGIDHLLPSVEGTRRHARRAGKLRGGLGGKR